MAINFDVREDIGQVLDGLEPVTVVRRGKAESIPVANAWRYSSISGEADPTGGSIVQSDAVWQLAWDEEVDLPRVGDTIVDQEGACWTILTVEQLGAKTRVRCVTRNLSIAFGLDNKLDIQVAVVEDQGSGPEIVGWQTIHTAMPGRIQPDTTTVEGGDAPPTSSKSYRVTLGEQIALDHNHRILGPDGAIYQIVEFTQAERIDVLPMAKVIRVDVTI
jgi:hypothetical protein